MAIWSLFIIFGLIVNAQKTVTTSQQGTDGGYFYSFWTNGGGSVSMTLDGKGGYTTQFSNVGDFTCGKGWSTGSSNPITFSGSYSNSGGGNYAVYGWSENPLVEYYITETPGSGGSSAQGTLKGNFTSDGATYLVYLHQQVNQPSIVASSSNFSQFISIRQTPRTSGTVTVSNHFTAWSNWGMNLGSLNYQIFLTEAWSGSGSSSVTLGSSTPSTSTTKAPTTSPTSPTTTTKAPPTTTAAPPSCSFSNNLAGRECQGLIQKTGIASQSACQSACCSSGCNVFQWWAGANVCMLGKNVAITTSNCPTHSGNFVSLSTKPLTSGEQVLTSEPGAIAGIVGGGAALVVLMVALVLILRSKNRKRGETMSEYAQGATTLAADPAEVPLEEPKSGSLLTTHATETAATETSTPETALSPKPPTWEQRTDPSTGNVFWFNSSTGVSQWETPDEIAAA